MRILSFPEIDSTNEEAKRLAASGDPGEVWIRADRQTAGRGRRGRAWTSSDGNLMTTLLLRPTCDAGRAAQMSFVAALAVADLVAASVTPETIALKWPNDVLVREAKIAGILLESGADTAGGLDWLAIGIGVNLRRHPDDLDRPVTDIHRETGAAPEPDAALSRLAARFEAWRAVWDEGRGFKTIRTAWLARAQGLGQPVNARLMDRTVEGIFEGLDDVGGLVLTLPDGSRQTLHGGEVYFGAPSADGRAAQIRKS